MTLSHDCAIKMFILLFRHPVSKIKNPFKASSALRHRPVVERNIYSATHSGVRASDVRPQPSAPTLRMLVSVGRSITSMRLPAIPPSDVDSEVLGVSSHRRESKETKRDRSPAPPPRDVSPQTPKTETNLDWTYSYTKDPGLQTPVICNPDGEKSDSDDSYDDKEYIPQHRFIMVLAERVNTLNEKRANVNNAREPNKVEDPEQLQYIADDGLKKESIELVKRDVENKVEDTKDVVKESRTDTDATNIIEEENPIENTNIDKDNTMKLGEEFSMKRINIKDAEIAVPQEEKD